MIAKYGDKIAVGVDAKEESKSCNNGWEEVVELDSLDFCKDYRILE